MQIAEVRRTALQNDRSEGSGNICTIQEVKVEIFGIEYLELDLAGSLLCRLDDCFFLNPYEVIHHGNAGHQNGISLSPVLADCFGGFQTGNARCRNIELEGAPTVSTGNNLSINRVLRNAGFTVGFLTINFWQ